MNAINAILTQLAEFLLSPFASRPLIGLLFWSVVAGVLMTFAFGKTSSQRGLQRAADQTRSELLAIKLFKDDLGVVFRSQIGIFKATGLRLLYSLPPMLVLIIPFFLILSQLGLRSWTYMSHKLTQPLPAVIMQTCWLKAYVLSLSQAFEAASALLPF